MKKIISIILGCVMLFSSLGISTFAADDTAAVMPRLNNVAAVDTIFSIDDGEAVVIVSYIGYPGVTTSVKITTTLQKRTLLFFWSEVTSWSNTSYEEDDMFRLTHPVSSGTYRVKVKYEINGTGGTTDVIEETLEDSY